MDLCAFERHLRGAVDKKPRHFTLMIVPETSGVEVKRFRLSRRLIRGVIAGAFVLVLATVGAVLQSAELWGQADANRALKEQNEELRAALQKLDDRVIEMDDAVQRLGQFDQKLRALTMVSDPGRNLAIGPVGAVEDGARGPAEAFADALRADLLAGRVDRAVSLVKARVELTDAQATTTLDKVSQLSGFLEGQRALLASTPSRRPTHGYVTSTFGMRVDPFTGLAQRHAGIDYSANIGAPVHATADGTVVHAAVKGAYGNAIEIDHGQGLVTKFAHLSKMDVRLGQKVTRGQQIGAVGNTGRSTGPHLHYEVRLHGIALDPQRFLLE